MVLLLGCSSTVCALAQVARSPCDPNRDFPVDAQRERAWHHDLGRSTVVTAVVVASWFDKDCPSEASRLTLLKDGDIELYRNVGWAHQTGRMHTPGAKCVQAVRALLAAIPKSDAMMSNSKVLLVSWRRAQRWTTRQYDRTALPVGVADLLKQLQPEIAGEIDRGLSPATAPN